MKVYYVKDADQQITRSNKEAILGYNSPGHTHANDLQDRDNINEYHSNTFAYQIEEVDGKLPAVVPLGCQRQNC